MMENEKLYKKKWEKPGFKIISVKNTKNGEPVETPEDTQGLLPGPIES